MCEEGNECCIATHLGCDVSGWAVNDQSQSSFLRADPERDCGCGDRPGELEQSLDRLLTKVGLNK